MARPGGNITGFSNIPEFSFSGKWLELLREIAKVSRVGLLINPETTRASESMLRPIESARSSFGVDAIRTPVHKVDEIEASIAEIASKPNGA